MPLYLQKKNLLSFIILFITRNKCHWQQPASRQPSPNTTPPTHISASRCAVSCLFLFCDNKQFRYTKTLCCELIKMQTTCLLTLKTALTSNLHKPICTHTYTHILISTHTHTHTETHPLTYLFCFFIHHTHMTVLWY